MKTYALPLLIVCSLLAMSAGCKSTHLSFLNPWQQRQQDAPPILFSSLPPKEELVAALNMNSARVQRLQTQGASVSIAGYPSVGAEIALERPNRLRFRASSSLAGSLVDMGSNEEMLWFWTSQASPPSVYFARHDRLANSPARRQLAIDPAMFVEALGLVEVAPEQVLGEPIAAGKDRIQVVCRQQTPAGEMIRTLQIHNQHGYLMEQQIADSAGHPMLTARLSQHRHYKMDGVTLPHQIDLHVPGSEMRVKLDVTRYAVNQDFTTGAATFAFPQDQLGQHQLVDIADPNFVPPGTTPTAYSSPGYAQPGAPPPAMPRYRGAGY